MGQFAGQQRRHKLLPFPCAICLSTFTVCCLPGNCFILEEMGSRRPPSIVICSLQTGVQDHAPSFPNGAGQRGCRGGCLIHCMCGPLEMPGPEPAHLPTPVTAHGQGVWEPHWSSAQGRGPGFTPGCSDPTPMSGRCHHRSVWAELCSSECWGPVSPAQQVLPSAGRRRMRFGFAWLIALPL